MRPDPAGVGRGACDEIARMSSSPGRNPFFPLVVLSGAAFVVTTLALVASTWGASEAPLNRLLAAYGVRIILVEAAFLMTCAFLAMALDSRQSRIARSLNSARASTPSAGASPAPGATSEDAGASD